MGTTRHPPSQLRVCSQRMQKLGFTDEMEGDWIVESPNRSIRRTLKLTLLGLGGFVVIFMLHNLTARSMFWQFWNAPDHENRGNSKGLRFGADGKFRISIFEDLHFGEAEHTTWGPLQDLKTQAVMTSVLTAEHPDLVVLNGDLITGENTFRDNSTHYLDQLVSSLVSAQVPWACTYGNHDRDFNLSISDLLAVEQRYDLSLTQRMVHGDENDVGVTNYYLLLYPASKDQAESTPVAILYFLDSRGGTRYQAHKGLPNLIHSDVLLWLKTTAKDLTRRYNKIIPSIAFFHIPLSTMLNHQKSAQGVDSRCEPGLNDDNPLDSQLPDSDVIATIMSLDGLIASFSGHDHGNDWCMPWNRSLLIDKDKAADFTAIRSHSAKFNCFGRRTGYGGYGDWARGSRQLLLDINKLRAGELDTWIRLEDGTLSGQISLNATYGSDRYDSVDRRRTPEEVCLQLFCQ